jgi:hypothetical protein
MLDWDALIPSTDVATPSESGISSPKTGDIPGLRGALSSYPGIGKASDTKGFRDQSPESPVSPVQMRIPTIVTGCTDDRDRWVSGDAWCSNCTAVGHDDAMQGCP